MDDIVSPDDVSLTKIQSNPLKIENEKANAEPKQTPAIAPDERLDVNKLSFDG